MIYYLILMGQGKHDTLNMQAHDHHSKHAK